MVIKAPSDCLLDTAALISNVSSVSWILEMQLIEPSHGQLINFLIQISNRSFIWSRDSLLGLSECRKLPNPSNNWQKDKWIEFPYAIRIYLCRKLVLPEHITAYCIGVYHLSPPIHSYDRDKLKIRLAKSPGCQRSSTFTRSSEVIDGINVKGLA